MIYCARYICEKAEKNLLPKIILPILEELKRKKFFEFLMKYKNYSQREKDETTKASFDEKQTR